MPDSRTYRALVRLYPKEFRDRYCDDLAQAHADLVSARGRSGAWRRSGLDLIITVPRYRLESIMNARNTDTTLHVVAAALLVAAVAAAVGLTLDVGIVVAIVPFALAILIAIAQSSSLGRSLRAPDSNLRHRRLKTAAWLGGGCVAIIGVFIVHVGRHDDWGNSLVLVAYNLLFAAAFIGCVTYLIAGLLTRRGRATPDVAG